MHTPGPWRRVATEDDGYYTHQIEITGGHIASIVGWSKYGQVCQTTAANANLIEHAPDLADALNGLLRWEAEMGGWEAPCWQRARNVLRHATGSDTPFPDASTLSVTSLMESTEFTDQAWNDQTKLSLLLDFLDIQAKADPILVEWLRQHLRDAVTA